MITGLKKSTNIVLLLFILVLLGNCTEEKKENKNEKENIQEIKTVAEEDSLIINIDPAIRRFDETPEEYQVRVAGNKRVKKRTATNYLYDLKGTLIEKGVVTEDILFDTEGRKIEHIIYRGPNLINYIWKLKYDSNNNIIEFDVYDGNNQLQLKRDMFYNEADKVVSKKEKVLNKGSNEINYKYTYDEQGRLIETQGVTSDGKEKSEKREYNSFGKLNKVLMLDAGKVMAERNYKYDSKGNLVEETLNVPNKPAQTTTYGDYSYIYPQEISYPGSRKIFKYNNRGDLTLDILFNSGGGRQHKFINEYDDKGLLVKKTRYDAKDKPVLVIKYGYEFYK